MHTGRVLAIASLTLCGLMATAKASPITYTESATVTGSLAGTAFTNDLITITGTGDTANVVNSSGLLTNLVTATFALTGGGSGTFTTQSIFVFDNQNLSFAGFQRSGFGGDILETSNSAFATYALATSLAPVSGTGFTNGVSTSFSTSAGALIISLVTGNATFSASTGINPVPLPGALPLFATGLGALGLLGWRRKKKLAA